MARKNKKIVVKVYINGTQQKAEASESPVQELVKEGIFKPAHILSGGALLLSIAHFVAHFFGKM